ncbi:MAG: response regulator [Candidatus Kariarchaeaceae archaeon]|jgi:CheY-like chemotaxis protein
MQNKDRETADRQPVILFADDDKFCLDVGVKMLKRLGYTVLESRDGHEAIEVYKKNQNRVDLVILDMKMPHNGGLTFEQLRKMDTDVKIFITSGYTEDHRIMELINQGCDGFIQKPFSLSGLSQIVEKALST